MAVKIILRHDTAANWTSYNPTLSVGELGYETDTGKFKIGSGTTWSSQPYVNYSLSEIDTLISDAVAGIIDLAPGTLDTLNELAAAINNDPTFFTTVATDLSNHEADTTNIHGIADTSLLATKSYADTLISTEVTNRNNAIGAAQTSAEDYADSAVANHNDENTNVHGIANTADLVTKTYVDDADTDLLNALDAHMLDTSVHGTTGNVVGTSDIQTLTNKTMGDDLLMDGNQVSGLGDPTQSDHAATKAYVDSVSEGLHVHDAALVATTANINITTGLVAGQSIDGVTLAATNRVLVKNQSTAAENGIYVVQTSGAAIRALDFDTAAEVESGDFIFVTAGNSNASTGWVQTQSPATIGSDPISFTQFSGAGTYLAGNGLLLNNSTFSIDTSVTATRTFASGEADTAEQNAIDHANFLMVSHNVTTDVHGIVDTAELATNTSVASDIADHNSLTSNVHGIANTSLLATGSDVETAVANHSNDISNVHGIADTSLLLTTSDKSDLQDQIDLLAPLDSPTFSGTVTLPSGTTIGSISQTELAILDGLTVTTSELNTLDGITSSTAELNLLDGVVATTSEINKLSGLTASTIELNTLDGITASTSELNTLDGITASTSELNTLDGITATVSELNILDGVTATALEINTLDGITASTAELNTLDGITASVSELNILDGVVSTATELNYSSGVTSSIQTQLDAKASTTTVSSHTSATTSVHGIADTSLLETTSGAQTKADAAETAANSYTDTTVGALTTSDIAEGSNQYFTDERAQDAVGSSVGSGLKYTDSTGSIEPDLGISGGLYIDGNNKLSVDGYYVTFNGANQTLSNKTIDTANNDITVVASDISDVTASAAELNILDGATLSTTELNYVDGVTSAIQTQLNAKAPLAGPTLTGTTNVTDLVIGGTLTFSGTAQEISSTNLSVTDSLIYLAAEQYDTDAVDIGIYGAYGDSNPGHFHTGFFRDASDGGKWKLISGGAEPSGNVIGLTGVTYDTLKLGTLEADSATIGDVSNTELQYLNGVTSSVQTQIDNKQATITGGASSIVSANLTASRALASDVSGKVSATSVTSTELGYVSGVTSGIQSQIDSKQASITGAATTITNSNLTTSRALTSDSSGKVAVSSVTSTELGYVSGVTSSIQTQLGSKAPTSSPTFTGTVTVAANGIAFTDATQTKAGVPSISSFVTKTASYTVGTDSGLAERDLIILVDSTSSATISIPTDATTNFPVGTSFDVIRLNTGALNIAAVASGTTSVVATPGLNFRARYSSATCLKIAANSWIVYGDLAS